MGKRTHNPCVLPMQVDTTLNISISEGFHHVLLYQFHEILKKFKLELSLHKPAFWLVAD